PYMIISGTATGLSTTVGTRGADLQLMAELGAKKMKLTQIYSAPLTAVEVLNFLELKGWKVVAMADNEGWLKWTLHREEPLPTSPPTYSEKPGQPTSSA
ncbi:hypothetical protein PENTCL1PPCAC_14113, partial [Pristionchus entomophagus]